MEVFFINGQIFVKISEKNPYIIESSSVFLEDFLTQRDITL